MGAKSASIRSGAKKGYYSSLRSLASHCTRRVLRSLARIPGYRECRISTRAIMLSCI